LRARGDNKMKKKKKKKKKDPELKQVFPAGKLGGEA
jgi:hypothetical protein